ncbi:MAG: site-2 protease family protein [bacterium]|nr:site-2 protease family protein [bacterium]
MLLIIISIVILVFSIIIHEISHGFMADRLGDPTARLQGRLTLNPISHIDPIGSILVPLLTFKTGYAFGWAKPVPYNPYNLKDKRKGEFLIAAAGPLSNITIALIFGIIIRLTFAGVLTDFILICSYIVQINLVLAIFNLVPIPPLDGSKLLFSYLPQQYGLFRQRVERFSPILILIFVFFLWRFISPIIQPVFKLFTGLSF